MPCINTCLGTCNCNLIEVDILTNRASFYDNCLADHLLLGFSGCILSFYQIYVPHRCIKFYEQFLRI